MKPIIGSVIQSGPADKANLNQMMLFIKLGIQKLIMLVISEM